MLLDPRVAIAGLLGAALMGAWSGLGPAREEAMHLAEVRYLDAIDPVHRHP